MIVFPAILTFLAAVAVAVWGLLLVRRGRLDSSALVKTAGVLALAGAIAAALCAIYHVGWYARYGDLERCDTTRACHASMMMMERGVDIPRRGMGMQGMRGMQDMQGAMGMPMEQTVKPGEPPTPAPKAEKPSQ